MIDLYESLKINYDALLTIEESCNVRKEDLSKAINEFANKTNILAYNSKFKVNIIACLDHLGEHYKTKYEESIDSSLKDDYLRRSEFAFKLIEEAKLIIHDQKDIYTNLEKLKSIDDMIHEDLNIYYENSQYPIKDFMDSINDKGTTLRLNILKELKLL